MKTKSALTGLYTERRFWYQQFQFGKIKIVRVVQPTVVFDAVDDCRVYSTTIKTFSFQDDTPSIPINVSKYHYFLI